VRALSAACGRAICFRGPWPSVARMEKGMLSRGKHNQRDVAVIGGAQFSDIMCARFVQFLRSCEVWRSCVFVQRTSILASKVYKCAIMPHLAAGNSNCSCTNCGLLLEELNFVETSCRCFKFCFLFSSLLLVI